MAGILVGQQAFAQSVSISSAALIKVSGNNVVYVSGTLTPVKRIPITGYTVQLISSDGKTTPVTTQSSNGGSYSFAGTVAAISGNPPYSVKVITNRQVSSTANAVTCTCN